MRNGLRPRMWFLGLTRDRVAAVRAGPVMLLIGLLLLTGLPAVPSRAADVDPLEKAFESIVLLAADVPSDARTVASLGEKRGGGGILIDGDGLIVTIGYLILEAERVQIVDRNGKTVPAEIVAYDHDTGFGLVRALAPLDATPARLGSLGPVDEGTVLFAAGPGEAAAVNLMEKRSFAGGWEYLLEEAAYTSPPIRSFGGAGLFDEGGRLIGIGSLVVRNAGGRPGNMFVPIDLLPPILGDMLAFGYSTAEPAPWIGVYPDEVGGGIVISRIAEEGPADGLGLSPGDQILAVGDRPVGDLEELWRRVRSFGPAGSEIPMRILSRGAVRNITLTSRDRREWLKLDRSY